MATKRWSVLWAYLQPRVTAGIVLGLVLLSEAKIGIIGIPNNFSFRDNLSPKVKSSLCEEELQFPAYDAQELIEILEQRAAVAFHDDVIDDGVIELCAAYGAKDAGDARQSLDLL